MSCETEPAPVWPAKHPDAKLDYAVNFESRCARTWEPWADFAQGTRIRLFLPHQASGFDFEATTAGRTAGRRPSFPSVVGQTVADGSVVWTCRALSSSSLLRTISGTPAWTAPSGITITNQNVSGLIATADIAGGTDGEDYPVSVAATASDGKEMVVVAVLPVRVPVRVCEG